MKIALVSCCLAKDDLSFPLGVLCIETAMRVDTELNKNSIQLFNSFCAFDPKNVAKRIVNQGFTLVGLSVYLWNRVWMDSLVLELKRLNSEIVFFAGGTEVTANYTSFDLDTYRFVTIGEGEISTIKAIKACLKGELIKIDGVRCKENLTENGSFPMDLSKLASPFLTGTAASQIGENRSILWEMTRGCPFRCNFCFESRGQRSVRSYPKERLKKELSYLIERKVEDVFVLDPTFNVDPKRSLDLLNMLIAKAPEYMHFSFEVRAELLNKELVERFSQFYCSLQMGLQTTNEEALKLLNRGFKKPVFTKNIELLNQANVEFGLDLIIGLPKDNLVGFEKSLDFALERRPVNMDIFLLSVLPGTVLFDEAKGWGLEYDEKPPYLIKRTQTMNEDDIVKALELKKACDFFYTEGKACMWFHSLCEALSLKGSQVLKLFKDYSEEDVFVAQDNFVRTKLKDSPYLKAVISFMELQQGIVYLQAENENPIVNLYYSPEDLAVLDHQKINRFVKEHEAFDQTEEYEIFYDEYGVLCVE